MFSLFPKIRYLWWSSHRKGMAPQCTPPLTYTHKTMNYWELWTNHVLAKNQAPKPPSLSSRPVRNSFSQVPGLGRGSRPWGESRWLPSPWVASPRDCDLFPPVKFIFIPRHLFLHNFEFLFFPQTYRMLKKGNFLKLDLSNAAMLFLVLYLFLLSAEVHHLVEHELKELAGAGEGNTSGRTEKKSHSYLCILHELKSPKDVYFRLFLLTFKDSIPKHPRVIALLYF